MAWFGEKEEEPKELTVADVMTGLNDVVTALSEISTRATTQSGDIGKQILALQDQQRAADKESAMASQLGLGLASACQQVSDM